MKTIEFVPELAKGESPQFKGKITLKLPTFDERFGFFEHCGFDLNDKGEVDMKSTKPIPMLRKMVEYSQKFYQNVELERVSDGSKYSSFEDLSYDNDTSPILVEVAGLVMNGFKISPN
jgi:hypothetical protein